MDAAIYKIIKFLAPFGVGDFKDITPTLLSIYKDVDPKDHERVIYESEKVKALLQSMQDNELISVREPDLGVGGGNTTEGFRWLDKQKYSASIKPKGIEALESEKNKSSIDRLNESMIETNASIRETNYATAQNIKFQKKSQIISLTLSGLSTIFILATVILSALDKTPQRLNGIETQMKEQSKAMQSFEASLKEISSSIRILTDSLIKIYK